MEAKVLTDKMANLDQMFAQLFFWGRISQEEFNILSKALSRQLDAMIEVD